MCVLHLRHEVCWEQCSMCCLFELSPPGRASNKKNKWSLAAPWRYGAVHELHVAVYTSFTATKACECRVSVLQRELRSGTGGTTMAWVHLRWSWIACSTTDSAAGGGRGVKAKPTSCLVQEHI